MAGIDSHNGECIRPIPYLNAARCQELKLLPGRVLSGQFDFIPSREAPHTEDCFYKELHVHKPCSSAEFNTVLKNTCSPSIQQGFKVQLNHQQRYISPAATPTKSLLTIAINPSQLTIIADTIDPKKIKINFIDNDGKEYNAMAITDLGFHHYAQNHYADSHNYDEINSLLQNQQEVFLRVGLSRFYKSPQQKEGFWIQINGIYSFPHYFKQARQYE